MCALCWQRPFLEAARGFITPILYKLKKKDFRWEINLSKSVLEQKKPKKFFEHLDFLWTFLSKKYTKQLFFWDLNLNCVRLISLNALQLEHSRKKNWEWSAGWLSILKGLSWKTSLQKKIVPLVPATKHGTTLNFLISSFIGIDF